MINPARAKGRWLVPAVLIFISAAATVAASESKTESLLDHASTLDQGVNGKRDAALTAEAYRIAADSGDAFAHLRLGYLYETGDGVPQDYVQARTQYQAAVNAGLNEARLRLAICHLEGWGGPVDREAFVREMRTAAEADYVPAEKILASMCFIGLAVPVDRPQGLAWLEKAAKHDDASSELYLGKELERAQRQVLKPDFGLVRSWYQLSAEQEYVAGSRAMAQTFLIGDRQARDWTMGQRWLQLATDSGDPEAPYTLALYELLHVDAPQHDVNKARDWLKLASQRGNPLATEMLQLEIGGRSLTEAARYMLKEPWEDRYVKHVAATAATNRDAPTRIPEIYRVVTPVYPQSLRLEGIQGEVIVDYVVDVTGRVKNARAIKGTHPAFGDRAVEAVNQWRFYPGRKNGHYVNVHMQVPVGFTLRDEELAGVDGLIQTSRDFAERLGPDVLADATELHIAVFAASAPAPLMQDGSKIPQGSKGIILLVLNPSGVPVRGHVLYAEPREVGEVILADVSKRRFKPRTVDGEAVQSNVLLPYRFGKFDDQVFNTAVH
ncbi:MAG: TonB family protein [Opitutaceae bacterium]